MIRKVLLTIGLWVFCIITFALSQSSQDTYSVKLRSGSLTPYESYLALKKAGITAYPFELELPPNHLLSFILMRIEKEQQLLEVYKLGNLKGRAGQEESLFNKNVMLLVRKERAKISFSLLPYSSKRDDKSTGISSEWSCDIPWLESDYSEAYEKQELVPNSYVPLFVCVADNDLTLKKANLDDKFSQLKQNPNENLLELFREYDKTTIVLGRLKREDTK